MSWTGGLLRNGSRCQTKTKFKTRENTQGTEIKSHAYRALRRSNLKEVHAVRYADDFKIFCTSHADAVRRIKQQNYG